MSETSKPTLGIYGAGRVGTSIARLALKAGYHVLMVGSPRQKQLETVLSFVAPGAELAASPEDLAERADIIIIAVPMAKSLDLPYGLFSNKIVIDAMNHWEAVDGYLECVENAPDGTSAITAARNPEAKWIKTMNHLGYQDMEAHSAPHGSADRRALGIAGDDPEAKAQVATLIDDLGFDPVDVGTLSEGQVLQPGHNIFGTVLKAEDLLAMANKCIADTILPAKA